MAVEGFYRVHAYVDESIRTDRDTGRRFYCVTGYIATFDAWMQAEIEWRQVLRRFGVSEMHFTDFMARKAEFRNDWSDAKRNQFMERLCTIASQRPILGVGCAISQKDWEQGLSPAVRKDWGDPYYFCIHGMLSLVRSTVLGGGISLPLPLFFLFDNRPKFEGAALRMYSEYQRAFDPEERIFDGVAFGSRKKYLPLQAADLLVGIINRRFDEMTRQVSPELSKMQKPLDLLVKKPMAIAFPTAPQLREFSDFARRYPIQP